MRILKGASTATETARGNGRKKGVRLGKMRGRQVKGAIQWGHSWGDFLFPHRSFPVGVTIVQESAGSQITQHSRSCSVFPSPRRRSKTFVRRVHNTKKKQQHKDHKLLLPHLFIVILVGFEPSSYIFQQLIASIFSISLSVQQTPASTQAELFYTALPESTLGTQAPLCQRHESCSRQCWCCLRCTAFNYPSVIGSLRGFTGSKLDLKWTWLCFPITVPSLDKPRPERCHKHIITPIWHMRHREC